MARLAGLALLLLLALPFSAWASNDFTRHLQQAARAYEQNHVQEALDSLGAAGACLWEKLPFHARRVSLLQAVPSPQGGYSPKADNNYNINDPLIIYFEPIGFMVQKREELYHYSLEVDFSLKDAFGHQVASQKRFNSLNGPALSFPLHLPVVISYNLAGLTPGDYHLETCLRDVLGKREHIVKNIIHIKSAGQE